jgi:ubiquinone/menaquinone biosynthesis C-methylase UbiE
MPSCSECHMLVNDQCVAYQKSTEIVDRPIPPAPLGACALPIVEKYLTLIKPGMRVLDIGCGSWELIKNHCKDIGAHYEGIDTESEYYGVKTVSTKIENLANLSYLDQSFDIIIGNQTMEHWAENNCSLEWGLFQCFRVCKENGLVLMNVPIHFHGTRTFMLGEISKIKELYALFSTKVSFEKWGNPSKPIPALYPWPGYSRLKNKPAYVLDIQAVKDCPTLKKINNRNGRKGRWAELINYPISFNLYRLLRKLALVPPPRQDWELGEK